MKKFLSKKSFMAAMVTVIMILSQVTVFAAQPKVQKIDEKYTWNLADIYKDQQAFDSDYNKLEKIIPEFKKFEGKLGNPKDLLEVLKLIDESSMIIDKLYWYGKFMMDLNIEDTKAADLVAKAEKIYNEFSEAITYVEPEIIKLPDETLQSYLKNPLLTDYKFYLEKLIKQKSHMLSKEQEEVIAKLSQNSDSPRNIYDNAIKGDWTPAVIKDKNGKDIKLTSAAYSTISENPDRAFRKKAFEAYIGSFNKIKNTCAATLYASVKQDETYAKLRGYKSGLDAALSADFVPESVFNNLIDAVNKNLPQLHKYIELRRKVMKLDKVHGYDMYVPLVDEKVSQKMKYPIDKAYNTVLEALKPLGEDYVNNVKYGFENRWLDVYPRDKKETGGYNLGLYGVHPFVLLNYDDSLDEMSTIAHEMGHAMHSVYSGKTQKYINANPPIFTAEVASTANELLLMDYLINNAKTDDEKLYLINKQIDNIRGTIYTQVMFSEFEKQIHEKVAKGEALTAEVLNKMWLDLIKKYNGSSYFVDEAVGINWLRISHFYRQFYVYKYATSMSASYELVKQMKEDKTGNATKRYLEFLSAGGSDYPIEVLKKAGVDMTSPEPVDNLLKYFGSLVDQMENILKKQGKLK
ncbi:MAG: oligoendopeptidase F [Caloramator sp.]|nr:oligoendopeptidase F [Caloramator sp.]